MATGFLIGVGDKTSCGGQVLGGDSLVNMFGILAARDDDQVSCGKDGKVYRIMGGISYMRSSGKLLAGNLDSISGCPCRATLFPSKNVRYESSHSAAPGVRSAAPAAAESFGATTRATRPSVRAFASPIGEGMGEEPGFHIVETTIPRHLLAAQLLTSPSKAILDKFNALNPGPELVKAGSMIVLSDPNNHRCTQEEAVLMSAAASAQQVLDTMSAEEANFMMRHREEIATFLSYSSTSVGVGTAMYARHLSELQKLLESLENLHQTSFLRDGHLRSPAFFAERKRMLALIDGHLGSLTRKGVGIETHPNLKKALGISSRSLVHHWGKAGAPGQIPGYATHLRGIATASKVIAAGGWVGVGISAGASYNKVRAVCTAGNDEICERVRYTETGSFVGSVAAGIFAAGAISSATTTMCVGIGAATMAVGGIICGVVVVGASAYAAGIGGEWAGGLIGDVIYRANK